jgi:hypothetical protein
MKLVRIRFDQVNEDEPAPLVVTVPLNDDNTISHAIPHAGWWGIPKGNNWCRPVIFKPDGSVDFGGDPEDSHGERYGEMQIFGPRIEVGGRFYMKDLEDGSSSEFVVRELIELD